jgi:hypothetical protein
LLLWNCGSGKSEEPQQGNVLRLIQIRLATPILKKYHLFVKHNSQQAVSHRFEFQKRSQLFIGMHNVTLSVAAMCVDNPDRSPIVRLLPSCGLERRLFTFWLSARVRLPQTGLSFVVTF